MGDDGLGTPRQGDGLGTPRQDEQLDRTASVCSDSVLGLLGGVGEEERIGLPMPCDEGALAPGEWQYAETQVVEPSSNTPTSQPAAIISSESNSNNSSNGSINDDRPSAEMALPPMVGGKLYVDPVGEAMLLQVGLEPPSPERGAGAASSSALAIVPSSVDGGEGASVAIVPRAPSVADQLLGDLPALSKAKAEAKSKSAAKAKAVPKATRGKAKAKALLDRPQSKASSASKAPSKAGAPAAAPKATPSVAAKRNRAGIQDETTRKTMRARLSSGQSKGFKYIDDSDKGRARAAAEEWMKSNCEE